MTNEELMAEIKELRSDVKKLSEEFFLFKGKSLGFISLLSVIINYAMEYLTKK